MAAARYDQALSTRNFAIGTTVLSVVFALAALVAGAVIAHYELRMTKISLKSPLESAWLIARQLGARIHVSPVAALALRLAMNACITLFTSATGTIQSRTTLWTLAKEDDQNHRSRLYYKSNPRLLLWTRSWATGFLALTAYAVTLIALYSAATFAFLTPSNSILQCWQNNRLVSGQSLYNPMLDYTATYVPFEPLITIGIGLLVQAGLAWAAYRSCTPLTWSTNPLVVAQAASEARLLRRYRVKSGLRQSLWVFSAEARAILRISWLLFLLSLLTSIAGIIMVAWLHPSGCFVRRGPLLPLARDAGALVISLPIFPAFLIMMGIQGSITLALHCCELIVNLSADESIWRDVINKASRKEDPLTSFFLPPQKSALLLSTPVLLWAFGNVFSYSEGDGLAFRPLDLLVFCVLYALLLVYITNLARRNPDGAFCSTTYGHIQTLVNLVHHWPNTEDEPLTQANLVRSELSEILTPMTQRGGYYRLPSNGY